MLNGRFFLAALFLSGLGALHRAEAQSAFSSQILPNGIEQTVALPASGGVGSLIFEIPGNISEGVSFSATAPAGTIFRLDGANMEVPKATLLSTETGWSPLRVFNSEGIDVPIIVFDGYSRSYGTKLANSSARQSSTTRAFDASSPCAGLSAEDVNNLIKTFSILLGSQLSVEDLCGSLGNATGNHPDQNQDPNYSDDSSYNEPYYSEEVSTYFDTYLRRNACVATPSYLYRLVTDINAVSPSALAAGATIKITVTRNTFKGKRGSTIKPKSDGRFSPAPLVLISTANVYPEIIEVNKWVNGGINSTSTLKIQDYVGYRGLTLARAVGTSVLKGGGTASFDITNRQNGGYSVCFELKKSRQKKNGYK